MILPRLKNDWPAEWLELFEERAGILEFCGNLPRAYAEKCAEYDTRQTAARAELPQEDTK